MTTRTPVRPTAKHEWMRTGSPRAKTHVVDQTNPYLRPLCAGPVGWSAEEVDGPTEEFPRCEACVFRLAFPDPFYVYTLHGAGPRPIYVGCTGNLFSRLFDHQRKSYLSDVVRTTVVGYSHPVLASDAEHEAIKRLRPLLNKSLVPYVGRVGGYGREWAFRQYGPVPRQAAAS